MGSEMVTRRDLRRALVVNAMTRPLNVVVPGAVVAAGVLLGVAWLAVVAVAAYLALAVTTFFDADEAQRVGRRAYARRRPARSSTPLDPSTLAEPIRERVEAAMDAQALIDQTVAESEVDLSEVPREVDAVVLTMTGIAAHADRVHAYLQTRDPGSLRRRISTLKGISNPDETQLRTLAALQDQLRAIERLREHLERFLGEMDHLVASLEVMHAQVVSMASTQEDVLREDVATQVRELRSHVDVMSEGVEEAFAETRVRAARGGVAADP
jgi:hypothetical protein